MAAIMQSMSSQKAWHVLEKNNLTTAALIEVTKGLRTNNLRKATPQKEDPKKGYSGVDGARKLLNDMIEESMQKYDKEIAECTSYYSSQCAAMEGCRGQIAASNYIAANSRSLIMSLQSCGKRWPMEGEAARRGLWRGDGAAAHCSWARVSWVPIGCQFLCSALCSRWSRMCLVSVLYSIV